MLYIYIFINKELHLVYIFLSFTVHYVDNGRMRLRGGGGRYGYHLIRDLLAVLIVFVLPNYDTGDKGHAANSSTCRGFSEQPALLNYIRSIYYCISVLENWQR